MLRKLLLALVNVAVWGTTYTDSHVKNIVSPKVDFSTNQLGSMSITFHWQGFFKPTAILPDLKAKVTMPFPLTAPMTVEWIQINDACVVSSNLQTTQTYASTLPTDTSASHFFDLVGAMYYAGAKYKMVLRITQTADIPTVVGNTDPITFQILSTDKPNPIVYGYNNHFGYFRISDMALGDFEFELTPSYADPNLKEFTRDFTGKADLRILDRNISRILLKLDSYVFSDDAESTCATEPDEMLNIEILDRNNFFCEFEDTRKKGLYFIWKTGVFPPIDKTFRIRFRVKNPDVPGSTAMTVAMLDRYSPKVLKFKTLPNAFSCGPTSFGRLFPKMYLGPNLDVSSDFYPNLTLFTKGDKANQITFNSIRLEFRTSLDLPKPAVAYRLLVTVGGSASTTVPLSLVYHDLPVALGFSNVKVSTAANGDLTFDNIGEVSSRSTYTVGFKVGFQGDETLVFLGEQSFGAIQIVNHLGSTVFVSRKAPPNVKPSFKVNPVANSIPSSRTWTTFIHSHSAMVNEGWANANINSVAGLKTGTANPVLLLLLDQLSTKVPATTANQNYIELITSQHVSSKQTGVATTDCLKGGTASTSATLVDGTAAQVASCWYVLANKGLIGSEYSLFRMGGKTNTFFSAHFGYGWAGTTVGKMSSLFKDGTEAAILDTYVNVYGDTYTSDVQASFVRGLSFTMMLNAFVFATAQFTDTRVHFINYNRLAANSLDGSKVPTLLRVSGKLTGVNTFKTKKLLLFFEDLLPLALNPADPFEVGCSTAYNADVKCYYYRGVTSAPCAAGTCKAFFARSRIEVLMSSSISSIADIYDLHVVIPVVVPVGTVHTWNFALGVAGQYEGTLSAYSDLLSVNPLFPAVLACSSCPGTAVADFLGGSMTTATVKQVLLNINNKPIQGTVSSSQFDFNCAGVECTIANTGLDYFSFTYCALFNFMADSRFTVNYGADAFAQCVENVVYRYVSGPNTLTKYCLYCPQFESGTTTSAVTFDYYKVPSGLGLKVPAGTYAAISGRQSSKSASPPATYGLQSLSNQALLAADAFSIATITSFAVTPGTIYYDGVNNVATQSIKLLFSMVLSNPVPVNGRVIISSAEDFPFVFMSAGTSPYCYFSIQKLACSITITNLREFVIRPTSEVSAGLFQIEVWGLRTKQIAALPKTHVIDCTTTNANAVTDVIERASPGADLVIQQYTENAVAATPNVLKVDNLQLLEAAVGYRTELYLDVTLGNLKHFFTSDVLKVNLNDGSYVPSDPLALQPVYCEVVDKATGSLLPEFDTCNVQDLAAITVTASANTAYNSFRLKLSNYLVKAASPAAAIPASVMQYSPIPATVIQQQAAGDTQPSWPAALATPTLLTSLTITKKISYFGFRSDFTLQLATSAVAIKYETRVYLQFPAPYAAGLSSFPISCYQEDSPEPLRLYCWRLRDRTLAITGFRKELSAGATLRVFVYGIQQPLHSISELFWVSVDADDSSATLSEARSFTMGAAPTSVPAIVPRVEVLHSEYSHVFIRAINSFLFGMKVNLNVAPGNLIFVYIDYLEFEFDIGQYVGICTIKQSKTSPNLAEECKREGNRYKIKVKTQLSANVEYTVLIENIPTPDFYACKVKRPEIIITDALVNLLAFSTDIFQNTDIITFVTDDVFTYFTFDNMAVDAPIDFKKGVFNRVEVVRMDGERFNDDFDFVLGFTENGIFSQQNWTEVDTFHSHFGLAAIPVYLSSSINSFTNEIPVTVNFTARFRNNIFAKLPLLRVRLVNEKAVLRVPASVKVWTSRGSLPFYVQLAELPLQDVSFTVSFTGTAGLLSASPASFTLGKDRRMAKLQLSSAHPAGPSAEVHSVVLTPAGASGYGPTVIPVVLSAAEAPAAASLKITFSEAKVNGFAVDVVGPAPAAFYSVTMPEIIFRPFSLEYIVNKFEANKRSDRKYFIDYSLSEATEKLSLVVNLDELKSKENYKTIFYVTDLNGQTSTSELTFSTQDSAGGFGYVNLTFASFVPNTALPSLICHMAQIFSYPLEKYATVTQPPDLRRLDLSIDLPLEQHQHR